MKKIVITVLCFFAGAHWSLAQDDLMSLLEDNTEESTVYTEATFKGSRLVNSHTIQTRKKAELEFLISHRFGRLNSGSYEFWGLDAANIRLGLEYGLTEYLTVGIGRNSHEKTYDGLVKVKLVRQSSGKRSVPFSLVYFTSAAIKTLREEDPIPPNATRMYYTHQVLIARKFAPSFSMQLMPSLIHRNSILEEEGDNDLYAIGVGGRIKLSKRMSLNAEYYYRMNTPASDQQFNSAALGIDIETGGHVFQLHLTNSRAMIEKGFITETTGDVLGGDIHFGFNVSRVF